MSLKGHTPVIVKGDRLVSKIMLLYTRCMNKQQGKIHRYYQFSRHCQGCQPEACIHRRADEIPHNRSVRIVTAKSFEQEHIRIKRIVVE